MSSKARFLPVTSDGKSNPTSRPVRCPVCKQIQTDLTIKDGRLWGGDAQVLGYVCRYCGRPIHWGERGATDRRGRPKPKPPGKKKEE
jgi:hypothetical protein